MKFHSAPGVCDYTTQKIDKCINKQLSLFNLKDSDFTRVCSGAGRGWKQLRMQLIKACRANFIASCHLHRTAGRGTSCLVWEREEVRFFCLLFYIFVSAKGALLREGNLPIGELPTYLKGAYLPTELVGSTYYILTIWGLYLSTN